MKLHAVGLRGAAELYPQQLSGGMGRRVALARAIAMDPDILIYDEPFAGLDPISMGVVLRLIRQLNDALSISSIVVTHDVREISQIADTSYILSDGQVVASGRKKELEASSSEIVRQFIGGHADGPVPFHYPAPDYHEQLLGGAAS
jgi:phospholipid/cholesterol/gamma-HCH transport system ATP-binding protein